MIHVSLHVFLYQFSKQSQFAPHLSTSCVDVGHKHVISLEICRHFSFDLSLLIHAQPIEMQGLLFDAGSLLPVCVVCHVSEPKLTWQFNFMHFQISFYVFLLLSLEQISLPLRVCFRSFQQEIISLAKVHLAVLGEMFGCHGVCVCRSQIYI